MLRNRRFAAALLATALFTHACPGVAQTRSAIEADALAFGAREGVSNMHLSPDGRQAVFVGPGPGRSTIAYHVDITAGSTKPILSSAGRPERLQWCEFASNQRLVCRIFAMVEGAGFLIPATRTLSMNTDGSDVKQLGQRASNFDLGLRQSDGSVIDWLPGADDNILMSRLYVPEGFKDTPTNIVRTKQGLGVVRINSRTLKAEQVEAPRNLVSQYISDGRGTIRVMGLHEAAAESQLTGRTKYLYRVPGSRSWVELVGYQDGEFIPLEIDSSLNALYALRKRDGRFALARVTLGATAEEVIVASHPKVDIDDVVRSADGQKVIGYTLAEDRRHIVYFEGPTKALAAALGKALPRLPKVELFETSEDGSKILIYAGADNDAGRYLLFDKASKQLGELMPVRPTLEGRTLARVQSISYSAADGTKVPAYLTLPPGKESAKGLPAVVLPHGGPSARDEWGFDWLPQFLAARGYAVIQPNYRGSSGFGDGWQNGNGFRNWRTAIGDIADSARYLAKQGIADPNRIAILGWSYGGYAALQAAAVEPSLFKAVVAIAPVTDLGMLKGDFADYSSDRITREFIGSGVHIEEGSPLRQARRVQAPVLLVHGDKDLNVKVDHSRRMDAALRGAGRKSELIEFAGLDHQLEDSDARALMLTRIGTLLADTIGG